MLIDTGSHSDFNWGQYLGKIAVHSDSKLEPWEGQHFVGASGAPLDVKYCCQFQ